MRKKIFSLIVFTGALLSSTVVNAQTENESYNWFNLDPKKDKTQGVSAERAYEELLKDKKSKTVIVAVIDSGTDTLHEDLKNKLWINKDEIRDNGIDDDNNGYIDDIYGWNFMGNPDGENINHETLEEARIKAYYDTIFKGMNETDVPEDMKQIFADYKAATKEYYEKRTEIEKELKDYSQFIELYQFCDSMLQNELGKEFTTDELKAYSPTPGSQMYKIQDYVLDLNKKGFDKKEFFEYIDYLKGRINYHYNADYNPRTIVGDDPWDYNDMVYGNNDVTGPDAGHGTMCAGVIGAERNNNLGIKGVADNVQFMILRAVPDGDERDKDIAKAIEYAVNNGAQIINMSFGKDYSPQKIFVDNAVRYADSMQVLMVHAAGNDGQNLDEIPSYPKPDLLDGTTVDHWITVGASSRKKGKNLPGNFSNYSPNKVDVFAPGVSIYTCEPGSKYGTANGTSFAGPAVSGVAAVLMSYFPELTPLEVKQCILESTNQYGKLKVLQPNEEGEKIKVPFATLSKTGGTANLYNAVLRAEEMMKEKQ